MSQNYEEICWVSKLVATNYKQLIIKYINNFEMYQVRKMLNYKYTDNL